MPRSGAEPLHYSDPGSKPAFPELVKDLAGDGKRWFDAELALAKAEAGLRLRGYAAGLGVVFASIVILVAAIVVLAQAAVAALIPHMSSPAVAGVVVGLVLLLVVAGLAFTARHLLVSKTPPTGLIFRWLTGDDPKSNLK